MSMLHYFHPGFLTINHHGIFSLSWSSNSSSCFPNSLGLLLFEHDLASVAKALLALVCREGDKMDQGGLEGWGWEDGLLTEVEVEQTNR